MRNNRTCVLVIASWILVCASAEALAEAYLTPPQVTSVSASSTFDRVTVVFHEIVDSQSAADVFNYVLRDAQQKELTLLWAQTNQDGNTVTLFIDPPALLEPGRVYTLTVRGIRDIAGNESFQQTIPFQSFVAGCGGLLFEAFRSNGIDGSFFGSYSELFYRTNIAQFDSQVAFPVAPGNSYEGRMRGVFVPPYSGRWIFYLRSDGQSRLWLNLNGPDPAGKQLVQAETGCCQAFEALPTQPFALTGGKAYYIEALYRQDFRPGYCLVAARLEGSTEALLPIGRRDLGQFALPATAGHITIIQQPRDRALLEYTMATMSVVATNDFGAPICYQWLKDGVEIGGANEANYSFLVPSICEFEQAVFSARLSIAGETVFSSEAILTVGEQAYPPTVMAARGSESRREIRVQFGELVDPTSAGDAFNYVVTDANGNRLEVESAARNTDGTSATLYTDLQAAGMVYTVTVNGVTDIACRPHAIVDGRVSFTAFLLMARVALSSNTVWLSWNSQTGRLYRIEFTDNLSSNWANISGEIVATGTNTVVSQPLNLGWPGRFYRIQAVAVP